MLEEEIYLLLLKEILIDSGAIIQDSTDMEIDNSAIMVDIIPGIKDQIDLEEIEEEDFKKSKN